MDQIKRIPTNKWTNKYQVDPVFLKSQLEAKAIKYLKNQNYLDYKKISQILKINYNKKYPSGYVLKTKNKVVGFLGTLFAKRKINNQNFLWKPHSYLSSYFFLQPLVFNNVSMVIDPNVAFAMSSISPSTSCRAG